MDCHQEHKNLSVKEPCLLYPSYLRAVSETGRCDEEVLTALHHGCEDREEKLRPVCVTRKTQRAD